MKKQITALVALLILTLVWSCEKDGSDTSAPATSFTITNLQYSPGVTTIKAHIPLQVSGTVDYVHAQNGVAQLKVKTSAGGDITVQVPGAAAEDGTVAGVFEAVWPTQAGDYTFDLWLVDGRGTASNKLTGSIKMTVSDAATTWTDVSRQYSLHRVIWANGKYVAVGGAGTILTSVNGGVWTPQNSGTSNTLYGACWTGSQYLVVGSNKTILTSPDGITWTKRIVNSDEVDLYAIACSGSQLVAVGTNENSNSSEILTSTDGVSWTSSAFKVTGGELTAITWSGSQYVVVGEAFGYPLILTSPNGATWTNRSGLSDATGQLSDVVWSGSRFVASGYEAMATSPDGVSWNVYRNPLFSAGGVTWSGSKFVAAGTSGIFTSTDGVTWTKTYTSTYSLRGITWSGFQYVAVGTGTPVIMVSP